MSLKILLFKLENVFDTNLLSPYYTMRFPYVALAIKQMKCTCNATDSTYITLLFFLSELNTLGVILKCYALFSQNMFGSLVFNLF